MKRLRVLVACGLLEVGLLMGMPFRPDEIEALLRQMNEPKMAHVLPSETENGDDPPAASSAIP